jgi:hypothetical protein
MAHARWTIQPLDSLRNFTTEWLSPSTALVSQGSRLYRLANGAQFEIARFPVSPWRHAVSQTRLGSRLLRESYYNVIPIKPETLFVTYGLQVAWIVNGVVKPIHQAFRVLRGGAAIGRSGSIYYGEYLSNVDRDAVSIWRLEPGSPSPVEAYRFPRGAIRHVHGVYRDWTDASLWITTGDVGNESRIMRTTDEFQTIETIGAGDESWRCVSLQFGDDAVWLGTDAEYQQNFLVRLDRRSGHRENIERVGGTVFYSARLRGGFLFGVTSEKCVGNPDQRASLWAIDADGCQRIMSAPADAWAGRYFQYGQYLFPSTPAEPPASTVVSCMGLAPDDGRSYEIRALDA